MARYSRRTGPAGLFGVPTPFTLIPGLTLTRFYDAGELFISYRSSFRSPGPTTPDAELAPFIDGIQAVVPAPKITIGAGTEMIIADAILITVAEGVHTIGLFAGKAPPGGVFIDVGMAQLSVIQFPLWDSDEDVQ